MGKAGNSIRTSWQWNKTSKAMGQTHDDGWTVKSIKKVTKLTSAIPADANSCMDSRVAETEVKFPTPASDLSKISSTDSRLRLLNVKRMKFGCQQFCSNLHTMEIVVVVRILCFNKVSKEIVLYHFNRIPNLGVWYKKWSNWTTGVGQKIRLRHLVLLEIRLRPKTSDSLRLRHRLRNPIGQNILVFCMPFQLTVYDGFGNLAD